MEGSLKIYKKKITAYMYSARNQWKISDRLIVSNPGVGGFGIQIKADMKINMSNPLKAYFLYNCISK